MSSIIIALAIIGFIIFVIVLLMYIHERDQKKEVKKSRL